MAKETEAFELATAYWRWLQGLSLFVFLFGVFIDAVLSSPVF